MTVLLADVVGWAGAGCLLLGYALLSTGRLTAGVGYHTVNIAGAVGLAVNGAVHHAWPSTALNLVWLGIGVAASRRARLTERGPGQPAGPGVSR